MALKIAVYMIANSEYGLHDAIASSKEADQVYLFDTLTGPNLRSIVDNFENTIYQTLEVKPWRFDVARNAALAMMDGDIDVCVALDSDEVLAPGWREEIERCWEPGTTIMKYMYDWSQGMTFQQAKIHSRHGYHWVYPCHERLHYYAIPNKQVMAVTDKFMMYHHPDMSKDRGSYLPLLLMAYREFPHHPQIVFYYGRELWKAHKVSEEHKKRADEVLNQFIQMDWKQENKAELSYAMRMLAQMNDSETAFKLAIDTLPTHREPYIWYADWLYSKGRYTEVIDACADALLITDRTNDYTVEQRCWDGYPYHTISWCYYHLGDYELATIYQQDALRLEPNNEDYKKALEHFRTMGQEPVATVEEKEAT